MTAFFLQICIYIYIHHQNIKTESSHGMYFFIVRCVISSIYQCMVTHMIGIQNKSYAIFCWSEITM